MAKKTNGQIPREELLAALEKPEEADKVKEAEAVLEADRQARAAEFLSKLQALCREYRCELVPMMQVKAQ